VRAAAQRQQDPKLRFSGLALANDLDETRKDSRLAGAEKDRRFKALMNR
jgi:hypothetical protein